MSPCPASWLLIIAYSMRTRIVLSLFAGLFFSGVYAQNVAINTTGASADASAMLDIVDIPRKV